MEANTGASEVSLSKFPDSSESEFSYSASRNRLLVAISMAESEGYVATRDALIELLKELEASKLTRLPCETHDSK
ncbi:hypothetical protein FIU86_18915 [Roseovarius sp. THAF9]|nr:hypothetical protein FIU86_18915 [Roseovarius sp. THAF9]